MHTTWSMTERKDLRWMPEGRRRTGLTTFQTCWAQHVASTIQLKGCMHALQHYRFMESMLTGSRVHQARAGCCQVGWVQLTADRGCRLTTNAHDTQHTTEGRRKQSADATSRHFLSLCPVLFPVPPSPHNTVSNSLMSTDQVSCILMHN